MAARNFAPRTVRTNDPEAFLSWFSDPVQNSSRLAIRPSQDTRLAAPYRVQRPFALWSFYKCTNRGTFSDLICCD